MPPRRTFLRPILAALLPVLCGLAAPTPAMAQDEPPCGAQPIAIARMQWPSAAILAEIHGRILAREFGCEVRIIAGDLAATGSSMATTSQPAVAPEMWVTRVADIWNSAVAAGRVRTAAATFSGGAFEGWYVPAYVAEAHPELAEAAQIAEFAEAFAPEGGRGRFISCPPNWACAILNRNLLEAWGLSSLFEIVEPANRFELDSLIAEAVSRQEPILFYYWQPNSALAQFDFLALGMGPYDPEAFTCLGRRNCDAPAPTAFVPEQVMIVLAEWVFAEAPAVAAYFQRATMPLEEMNALLAQQGAEGGAFEEVAERFVAEREDVWRAWVGE